MLQVADVTIDAIAVYQDGVSVPVYLSDLLAGHLFTEPGAYEIVIRYHFQDWEQEIITKTFTIIKMPRLAHTILSATKTTIGSKLPCGRFAFGVFDAGGALVMATTNK